MADRSFGKQPALILPKRRQALVLIAIWAAMAVVFVWGNELPNRWAYGAVLASAWVLPSVLANVGGRLSTAQRAALCCAWAFAAQATAWTIGDMWGSGRSVISFIVFPLFCGLVVAVLRPIAGRLRVTPGAITTRSVATPGPRSLVLVAVGRNEFLVVKELRSLTGIGLKRAVEIVRATPTAPQAVAAFDNEHAARTGAQRLSEVGADVEVRDG